MRDLRRALILSALLAMGLPAQDDPNKKKPIALDQASIDKAIEAGLKFLKTSDSPNSHVGDSDELKLLTFIHGGLSEKDPVFEALLKKCLDAPLAKTYGVALLAMCLEEVDRVAYQYKIAQCGQFLLDNIKANGGFAYGEPTAYTADVPSPGRKSVASSGGVKEVGAPAPPGEKVKPVVTNKVKLSKKKEGPEQRSDNSNAQYGALGLRACHDAGIVFPKEWVTKCRQYWIENQHPGDKGKGNDRPAVASGGMALGEPRGWCYNDGQGGAECGHGGVPYSSMTAGAIGALCIYDYMLGKEWKKNKNVLDGLAWLEKNWTVSQNIGPCETSKGVENAWLYYYLYALERTGMLYDTSLIGNHDWYMDGARLLLAAQKPDGSWDGSHFKKPTWDTCFAVLFLKRATRRLIASGGGIRK
jgi:hypothetical protein